MESNKIVKKKNPSSLMSADARRLRRKKKKKSGITPRASGAADLGKPDNFANLKARELATKHGVKEESLTGTGRNGKITSVDVKKALTPPKKEALPKYTSQPPKLVNDISELSYKIREKFIFGGKESHYQSALEAELQEVSGVMVQHEVPAHIHYKKNNGEVMQLPHDIRSREDLVLPREKLVLELKAIPALKDKDHCQLLRYMEERRKSSWGEQTRGMLINFGDTEVEIHYWFYKDARPQNVLVLQKTIPSWTSFVDRFTR